MAVVTTHVIFESVTIWAVLTIVSSKTQRIQLQILVLVFIWNWSTISCYINDDAWKRRVTSVSKTFGRFFFLLLTLAIILKFNILFFKYMQGTSRVNWHYFTAYSCNQNNNIKRVINWYQESFLSKLSSLQALFIKCTCVFLKCNILMYYKCMFLRPNVQIGWVV